MSNPFFERPIVNSPYGHPRQHWELDESGQPTGNLIDRRRRAEFITPIPKPKKRKGSLKQEELVLDEGRGLTTKKQAYDLTSVINEVRSQVDAWRNLPASQWQVTPETARLLQHWRHHEFGGVRPFFCQIEAIETAIWFTEVAPHLASGKRLIENLKTVNAEANPNIERLALKLATGAGKTTVMAMLIAWQTLCWFIDTDYNEESFFVRHAYFLGQNDPYGALKTTLKAEIDVEVWATLNSEISRPFPMPKSGRIAVKVINHLGDEVMKVFRVE